VEKDRIEVWIRFVDRHYCRVRFFRSGRLSRFADWLFGSRSKYQKHPTVFVDSLKANIDVEVAPLVKKLNSLGFETFTSCQGDPGVLLTGPGQMGLVKFTHENNELLTRFVLETLGDIFATLISVRSVSLTVERGASLCLAEIWFINEVLAEVVEKIPSILTRSSPV
jgi:hypothetical protein